MDIYMEVEFVLIITVGIIDPFFKGQRERRSKVERIVCTNLCVCGWDWGQKNKLSLTNNIMVPPLSPNFTRNQITSASKT